MSVASKKLRKTKRAELYSTYTAAKSSLGFTPHLSFSDWNKMNLDKDNVDEVVV